MLLGFEKDSRMNNDAIRRKQSKHKTINNTRINTNDNNSHALHNKKIKCDWKTISIIKCSSIILLILILLYYYSTHNGYISYLYSPSTSHESKTNHLPNTCNSPQKLSEFSNADTFQNVMYTTFNTAKNNRQEFETLLKLMWDKKMAQKNIFSYTTNNLPRRLTTNSTNKNTENIFNIQFELLLSNRERKFHGTAKTATFNTLVNKQDKKIIQVKKPWSEKKFNFYKADGTNLLSLVLNNNVDSHLSSNIFQCLNTIQIQSWLNVNLLLINKYPVGNYSGLFIPDFGSRLPQVLTKHSLKMAIELSNMFGSNSMRVGFNSLGAMATVNHLHIQFWDVKPLSSTKLLPIEVMLLNLKSDGILFQNEKLILYEFVGYPVHGFVFENKTQIHENIFGYYYFLQSVWHCLEYLMKKNIPHTLLFDRKYILLIPRKPEIISDFQVFYGWTDVSGWITVLNESYFHSMSTEDAWEDMKKAVSIDDKKWGNVKRFCSKL